MHYDVLILTDHTRHTEENSVYALAAALAGHEGINNVDIASKKVKENAAFFSGQMDAVLSVIPALPDLSFRQASELFGSATTEAEIGDYDFIVLRLPPPIPQDLFNALSEHTPADHLINRPSGIVLTSSKEYLTGFPDLCPPMQLVHTREEAIAFLAQFPLVLKPVNGYGGEGIFRLTEEFAENVSGSRVGHGDFFTQWKPPYLAMKFLPRVTEGDKRTIVVNGRVMGSALRKPAHDQWICNVAQGGSAFHAVADADEIRIAHRLNEDLHRHGVVIFGFDTLVGDDGRRVLSEINTMSIGGLKQTRDAEGHPILARIVDELVSHMDDVWYGIDPA